MSQWVPLALYSLLLCLISSERTTFHSLPYFQNSGSKAVTLIGYIECELNKSDKIHIYQQGVPAWQAETHLSGMQQ